MIAGLDARGLLYRAFFAGQGREPQRTLERFSGIVTSVLREVGATHLFLAWEDGPTVRHEMLAGYKAGRKPAPTALRSQATGVPAWARENGIPVVTVNKWEADDVLASVATVACDLGEPIVIVSDDKDLAQLLRRGVFQYRPSKTAREDRFADQFTVFREWGVTPSRIPDLLGLMGDSADNIPGVPGLGWKRAQRLIDRYGSVEGVLEHADGGDRDAEKVAAHADQALLCRDVATLRSGLDVGKCWAEITREEAVRA